MVQLVSHFAQSGAKALPNHQFHANFTPREFPRRLKGRRIKKLSSGRYASFQEHLKFLKRVSQ